MSRREDEFKHRTSIFEGAFRAWSYLGQLDPSSLQCKSAAELDPLTNPNFGRHGHSSQLKRNADGSVRPEFPYEPLPRSGLSHPYVKAVIGPWLGPEADNEAVELGLATLRTWWQHRRKGENKTSVKSLGTDKMRVVVDKYTRHFFELAHCLVVNDQAQPPRGLQAKLKDLEKSGRNGMSFEALTPATLSQVHDDLSNQQGLSALESLHAAQRHQNMSSNMSPNLSTGPIINVKGKCIPGKIDLEGLVDSVNVAANMHIGGRGRTLSPVPNSPSSVVQYGDPNTTPVVFESSDGVLQIVLAVDGITCAHCVKIVETVLRGCNGSKSPISGLLDAAADRDLSSVLIRIDEARNAKRIAFEAARNLSMVGYTATPSEVTISGEGVTAESVNELFSQLAKADPFNYFDWSAPCSCPDSGVYRSECDRHSQINNQMFRMFSNREHQVKECIKNNNSVLPSAVANDEPPIETDQEMDLDRVPLAPPKPVNAPESFSYVSGGPAARKSSFTQVVPGGRGAGGGNPRVSFNLRTSIMSDNSALAIDWEDLDDLSYEIEDIQGNNNAFDDGAMKYSGHQAAPSRREDPRHYQI